MPSFGHICPSREDALDRRCGRCGASGLPDAMRRQQARFDRFIDGRTRPIETRRLPVANRSVSYSHTPLLKSIPRIVRRTVLDRLGSFYAS